MKTCLQAVFYQYLVCFQVKQNRKTTTKELSHWETQEWLNEVGGILDGS